MKSKISASLMCADPFELNNTIRILESHKIDYLHIDIMDGKFVPNLGIGSDYINALKKHTTIPLDYHIMVKDPDSIINLLDLRPQDIVSVHYESSFQIQRTLENIQKKGKSKVMIAINPATPLCVLEELIYYIDGINLLMVNPGFAGQKMVDNCIKKAQKVSRFINKFKRTDIIFEVDGNISFENAKLLRNIGANTFVAGTSSIFKKGNIEEYILEFKNSIL
jgi:ribulose-phosphate 3-epimerase